MVRAKRVHPCSQILRRLQGEYADAVFTAGDPDVDTAKTPGPIRSKEQQMAIAGENGTISLAVVLIIGPRFIGRTPLIVRV